MSKKKLPVFLLFVLLIIVVGGCAPNQAIVPKNNTITPPPVTPVQPVAKALVISNYLSAAEVTAITGMSPSKYVDYTSNRSYTAWAYYELIETGSGKSRTLYAQMFVAAIYPYEMPVYPSINDPDASRNAFSEFVIFEQKAYKRTTYFIGYKGDTRMEFVKDILIEHLNDGILYRILVSGADPLPSDKILRALMEKFITNVKASK
ncbi:MAG: hypothetical protein Q8N36_06380 [bacterium]|nr:hypothetical protein [bacterium]